MFQDDPYRAVASPELDAFIREHVMKEEVLSGDCPPYSTDEKQAKRVLAALRATGDSALIIGRTDLKHRTWFARFETNAMDGTEVFADSFALAVCRIALLRLAELGPRKTS